MHGIIIHTKHFINDTGPGFYFDIPETIIYLLSIFIFFINYFCF